MGGKAEDGQSPLAGMVKDLVGKMVVAAAAKMASASAEKSETAADDTAKSEEQKTE